MAPVIGVHTHMLSQEWLKQLEARGGPRYTPRRCAAVCAPFISKAHRS
jgi:hypothetical protein